MPPSLTIRPYAEPDQAAIIELWQRCGLTRPWNDPARDIARKLTVQPENFLVGLLGEAVVASVMASFDGHRGWINYLAVDPTCQGNQFGRQMMDYAEARLLAMGCPKINLQVRADNTEVIAFYESLGYTTDRVISLGKRLIDDN